MNKTATINEKRHWKCIWGFSTNTTTAHMNIWNKQWNGNKIDIDDNFQFQFQQLCYTITIYRFVRYRQRCQGINNLFDIHPRRSFFRPIPRMTHTHGGTHLPHLAWNIQMCPQKVILRSLKMASALIILCVTSVITVSTDIFDTVYMFFDLWQRESGREWVRGGGSERVCQYRCHHEKAFCCSVKMKFGLPCNHENIIFDRMVCIHFRFRWDFISS